MTAPLDLDALKAKALAATKGPWEVQTDKHPHFRGGAHTEHRIRTAWIHGQLKDHYPVVTTSVGIPEFENGRPCRMVAISKEDADHIAAACPATMLELLARLETAEAEAAHYRGVANDVRRQQLGTAPIVDPTKGRYNCAGDYVMPKPVYDPSLQVPAEIVAAANMVSTWAAKQNLGSWRIGDVCSADFGNQDELARLRSGNAILRQQAEALHAIGHAIGVPAGENVTEAVLPAVKALIERAARAENIANSVLESITSKPNTVMVMTAGQAENVVGLAHELARIIPAKSTVIALQDGATLEQLDQDDMRRHGWVRADATASIEANDVEWIVNDMGELGVRVLGRCFFCYKGDSIEYKEGIHDGNEPILHRNVGKREFGETVLPPAWIERGYRDKRYTLDLVYTPGLSFGPPDNPKYQWLPLPVNAGGAQ